MSAVLLNVHMALVVVPGVSSLVLFVVDDAGDLRLPVIALISSSFFVFNRRYYI